MEDKRWGGMGGGWTLGWVEDGRWGGWEGGGGVGGGRRWVAGGGLKLP